MPWHILPNPRNSKFAQQLAKQKPSRLPELRSGQMLGAARGSVPRLSEALTWLHMRTRTLERIRELCPDTEVSRLAGQALTCGPDGQTLASMANAAMEKAQNEKVSGSGRERA